MSWIDVQRHFRARYSLDADMADELALTVHFQSGDTPRAQRVMVRRYRAWGEELVEVRSAFGEVGEWDAASLLTDSLQLPLGAIAAHGRYLLVVSKGNLAHLGPEGVEFLVNRIGMLADVLEERKGGPDRF